MVVCYRSDQLNKQDVDTRFATGFGIEKVEGGYTLMENRAAEF